MRIEVYGKVNRAAGRLTDCFSLPVCGKRVTITRRVRKIFGVWRILLPDCDNLQTKRGQLSGLLRRKRWQGGRRVAIVTSNEVDPAAPKLLDHIAGIDCQVDPERALIIGRPIEVGDLLDVQDLLQRRGPIQLCEGLK